MKKTAFMILILFSINNAEAGFFEKWQERKEIRQDRQEKIEKWRDHSTPNQDTDDNLGVEQYILNHDGLQRRYLVHTPSSYDGQTPVPLLLVFHGGGGMADGMIGQTKMNEKSDREGFIVVYPEGTGRKLGKKIIATWNSGRCCGTAVKNKIDDVGFVSAMLDQLEQNFNIDSNRIYATGHSNGAVMSYRLACELSDRIASIAPNAAHDSFDQCTPRRPVPVLHFHGTKDHMALYDGGNCGPRGSVWKCSSVEDYIDKWIDINNCPSRGSVTFQKGDATCITYAPCDAGSEVTLCTIEGTGHTWPGGEYYGKGRGEEVSGKISRDISANDHMWKFFQKHPLK